MVAYASQRGRLAIASVIGTASTVSNGYFLIFTAPGWILVGTAMAASQSRAARAQATARRLDRAGAVRPVPAGHAWGSVLAHPSSSEVGLLLNFRPPRPRWASTYELGLGLGQQQYRSYYPGDDIAPSHGLAFSAALAWPSPGPLGLKAEAFGNLLGAAPFVGLGVSLEPGWRPVLP